MSAPIQICWTQNRALAAVALGLGVVAIAGSPVQGRVVRVDTEALTALVAGGAGRTSPGELADRVVRGATDYRVIDVRSPAEFAAGHLPGAENVPFAALAEGGLARNERLVLVSRDGVLAAQAWMLLRAQGYAGASVLTGGLAAWRDEVVYPLAPRAGDAAATAAFARAVARARFFGGRPRVAAGADSLVPPPAPGGAAAPRVAVPAPPSPPPPRPAGTPKREGC